MSTALLGILAGLGGMFAWGTSDFFAALFSKKIGYFKTFFWSQAAGLVFAINLTIPALVIILLPIAAIFYIAAYLFFYKGLEIGKVSIISATLNLWAVFTVLFAFIFLGQRLSSLQLLGVFAIIIGVTFVCLKWNDIKTQNLQLLSGVKETILAAFFFGIFWNMSEIISERIGWLSTTIFVKIGVILFLLLFSLFMKREFNLTHTTTRTKLTVVLVGVLEAVAVISVNWGLTVGDVILVTPISSAFSVVTIAMAIIFLGEKITKVQGFGILTVIAGIVLTAF